MEMLLLLFGAIACIAGAKEPRVVGGSEATPFRESYVVALVRAEAEVDDLFENQFCGGSLIGDGSVVLTAAHCVADDSGEPRPAENFQAAVHWHDLEDSISDDECSALIKVKKVKVHPGNTGESLPVRSVEDVALLFLKEAAPCAADGRTKTVELDWSAGDRAGQTSRVLGWGVFGYFFGVFPVYPSKLQRADVTVISNRACSAGLLDAGFRRVEDFEVCAIRPGTDACFGDSGGPLVVYDGNRVVQIGVVSWGFGCSGLPGVYMRVSALADWIASKVDGIEEPEDCADDDAWYFKKRRKGCAWVAAKTKSRCKKKGVDGVKAKRACREACGRC